MEESEGLGRAMDLWRAAYRGQMEGQMDRAIEHYQRSIAVCPTAEALTFLEMKKLASVPSGRPPSRLQCVGIHWESMWE